MTSQPPLHDLYAIRAIVFQPAFTTRYSNPHASDPSRKTKRITFHVERRWIEAIRKQVDLDGLTYTQIVNEAFRQYFERK